MTTTKNISAVSANNRYSVLKKRAPVLALGWLIVNSSAITFFLGMPVYGASPSFWKDMATVFLLLSGTYWALNWWQYWPALPLCLGFFIFGGYVWFKKPSIFSAAVLSVTGMISGPANRMLMVDLLPPLIFIPIFLGCALIVQRVWNNWDAPAPTPEELKAQKEKRAKIWPLKKRLFLLALPVAIYVLSSSLCALGGAFATECEISLKDSDAKPRQYFSQNWRYNTYYDVGQNEKSDFSLLNLISRAWKHNEFTPAIFGKLPSVPSVDYLLSGNRFSFVLFFACVYAFWLWRPSWTLYAFTTFFFLLGTAWAKFNLVWQFLNPAAEYPELREQIPEFLYLWAAYSPF